jgi:hypothetical protein
MSDSPQTLAEASAAFREAWIEFVAVSFFDPIIRPLRALLIRVCRWLASWFDGGAQGGAPRWLSVLESPPPPNTRMLAYYESDGIVTVAEVVADQWCPGSEIHTYETPILWSPTPRLPDGYTKKS